MKNSDKEKDSGWHRILICFLEYFQYENTGLDLISFSTGEKEGREFPLTTRMDEMGNLGSATTKNGKL